MIMYEKKKKKLPTSLAQVNPVYYSVDIYNMFIMHCYDVYGVEISCGLCRRFKNGCEYEKKKKQAIEILSRK